MLPTPVLVEVCYLLQARLGHHQARHFLQRLIDSPIEFEPVRKTDLPRLHQILEQYASAELDFVDASIVTIAERMNIQRILTVDQRDFRMICPTHCAYFEILPNRCKMTSVFITLQDYPHEIRCPILSIVPNCPANLL